MAGFQLPYTDEQLFPIVNNMILPCWVLLALIPTNKLTQTLVLLISFLLCILYGLLVIPLLLKPGGLDAFKQMTTYAGMIKLFSDPHVLLGGWVHYAVGDLWVGRWIALDAAQRRVPRLLMVPVLAATMLLAPVGLGAYFLVRTPFKAIKSKRE